MLSFNRSDIYKISTGIFTRSGKLSGVIPLLLMPRGLISPASPVYVSMAQCSTAITDFNI